MVAIAPDFEIRIDEPGYQIALIHERGLDISDLAPCVGRAWEDCHLSGFQAVAAFNAAVDRTRDRTSCDWTPDLILVDRIGGETSQAALVAYLCGDVHLADVPVLLLSDDLDFAGLLPGFMRHVDAVILRPVAYRLVDDLRQIAACSVMKLDPFPGAVRPAVI